MRITDYKYSIALVAQDYSIFIISIDEQVFLDHIQSNSIMHLTLYHHGQVLLHFYDVNYKNLFNVFPKIIKHISNHNRWLLSNS